MKIDHEFLMASISKARELRETIEHTEKNIERLKSDDTSISVQLSGRWSISNEMDDKTKSVIRALVIQDLENKKKTMVEQLENILTGGIQHV